MQLVAVYGGRGVARAGPGRAVAALRAHLNFPSADDTLESALFFISTRTVSILYEEFAMRGSTPGLA